MLISRRLIRGEKGGKQKTLGIILGPMHDSQKYHGVSPPTVPLCLR